MVDFVLLFSLTVLSATLGNVKNILLIKGSKVAQIIVTGIDTLFYTFILKSVVSGDSACSLFAFVLGKSIAILTTDLVMSKIGKTVYLAHLYEKKEDSEKIADYLTIKNISFTIFEGDYVNGTRYMFTLHLNKDQINELRDFMTNDLHIQNITMDISEVKVSGHIKDKV